MGNCDSSNKNKISNLKEKTDQIDNKPYILSESISKRDDFTKNYKLLEKLGEGATSIVYIGENLSNQKFAIKHIIKSKIKNKQNNIIKEAEICLKLKNKNIINYYEIYEDINYINIVMELGETDLYEFIVKSPSSIISEDLAIDFLKQIFESIIYLHNEKNIIHCDIKPENYIIIYDKNNGNKPILKLIDFGNIRQKPINNNEKLYNFSGTKEFMAPEALENSGFNEKIDEWAAGIIMYNMLTGVDPFMSDNDYDYRENIKFKKINFELIKNENLREINKKLLNRFVSKRITAKEALDEIQKIKII